MWHYPPNSPYAKQHHTSKNNINIKVAMAMPLIISQTNMKQHHIIYKSIKHHISSHEM
jgi:hypothetical protein